MVFVYTCCAILASIMWFASGFFFDCESIPSVFSAIMGALLLVVIFFMFQPAEEDAPNTATCPTCRVEVTTNFCPRCGWAARQSELHCPTCDAVVDDNFCPYCGLSKEYMK